MDGLFSLPHLVVIAVTALQVGAAGGAGAGEDWLSPEALVLSRDGSRLYVAEYRASRIAVVDTADGKVKGHIGLPLPPTGLALAPGGSRLYVTGSSPEGRVHVVDLQAGRVCCSIPVGHTPVSPVVGPDGGALYVCNRFDNDVSFVDLASGKELARVPVSREPVAAALTADGRWLFVANLLPTGPADRGYIAAAVSAIDVRSKSVTSIQLPDGSTGLRGICISPCGAHVYVTHLLAHYQFPTTQLERGWMNTNALSIIDAQKKTLLNTVLLDDFDLGAASPWGVACTADGKVVCVAHAGTHEVSVIETRALHEKLAQAARGQTVSRYSSCASDVPYDVTFVTDIRRRLQLAGNGPRGLVVAGSVVYTTEYFSDSVGVVDLRASAAARARSWALGPAAKRSRWSPARKGEMYFNDATLCHQQWQSCASCHPDARSDCLNWDLLNDGVGTLRNTKSLLFSHATPPAMVTGVRETAELAVRAGISNMLFGVRREREAQAIDAFLKSLEPVPSPLLVKGRLSESARRGRGVFVKAGCAACHSGKFLTRQNMADIKTGKSGEEGRPFDTPHLREIWRTAPYLHDGRAESMEAMLTAYNAGDHHGRVSDLTPAEIADLVEYVMSN
jgi:YVTN family beta-propeller protein